MTLIPQPKPTKWFSQKYRDAAKGQHCTLRIWGCGDNTETTVLAHENGGGMGTKHSDHNACDACKWCHDALDGIRGIEMQKEAEREFERARYETLVNRITRGILK